MPPLHRVGVCYIGCVEEDMEVLDKGNGEDNYGKSYTKCRRYVLGGHCIAKAVEPQ